MTAPPPFARPPERIVGERVVLRRNRVEDGEAIARAVGASLEHLEPWMPWATPEAATAEAQRGRIVDGTRGWDEGTDFVYVVLTADERTLLGTVGLHRRIGPGGIEIGYWIHVDHAGRGYGTATVRALTEVALALPDVGRVEIHCDEANAPSQAIPRRLGYRLDRIEVDGISAPGEVGRSMIWVLERQRS